MKIRVLGCSGGIGGCLRTTSMLIDDDILLDAGTGVGELSIEELAAIDHVFVTHSHMDHIASIPFLVDTTGGMRSDPLVVHATSATLDIIRTHIFNWKIWPDFSEIPSRDKPYLRFEPVHVGRPIALGSRAITPVPANHVVPAVGYHLDSGRASLVFTGDTTSSEELWRVINNIENLRYLIIETAFCNRERDLAIASKHLCPSMLAEELAKLKRRPEIYITHLKPGEPDLIMQEISECVGDFSPRKLCNNQVFKL
ncbi:MAG: 3',5'-cyclic-nucleotide phosphodiesterase [Betaproteobacteria bacterium]|nr:MAG: 3',5'-cyclic-nucleotide phosphodiesterase [Betaproteobacteria bacterium]